MAMDAAVSASASASAEEGLFSAVSAGRLQTRGPHRASGRRHEEIGEEGSKLQSLQRPLPSSHGGKLVASFGGRPQGALIATWEFQGSCSSTLLPVASF
jgi:hypothetical protein